MESPEFHGIEATESRPIIFSGSKIPQILAALAATIGAFGTGTMLGWSSPGIPDLEKRGDLGILSGQDKSWIGSIVNLGALLAGIVAGYLIERIGRKHSLMAVSVPFVIGWVLLACSQNLAMMLVARFITGFGGGAFTLIVPVYISEIAEDSVRGRLGSLMVLVLVSGILFTYVLGSFVSWIWLAAICSIFPVIMFVAAFFMPETPSYLLKKGKVNDAASALKLLRGAIDAQQIEPELKMIQKSIEESMATRVTWKDLIVPSILKPLLISMALMFFQQLGGINAVIFYSVTIFEAAGSNIDPNVSSIIIGSIQVFCVGISTVLMDRAGRKMLLIISETGMAISLAALGVFFYLKEEKNAGEVPEGLGWLPLVSLILYMITYNVALGPVPWLMMGELLPTRVKGLASGIATSFCWLLAFVVTKTFEDLSSAIHPYGCYWLFSVLSAVGAAFAIFIVPETKGKSLDEIQSLFS